MAKSQPQKPPAKPEEARVRTPKEQLTVETKQPAPEIIRPGVDGIYGQRPQTVTDKGIDLTTADGRKQVDDLMKKLPKASAISITWGFFLKSEGPGVRPLTEIKAKGDTPRRYEIVKLGGKDYIIMELEMSQPTQSSYYVKMIVELYDQEKHKKYVELRY